MEQRSILSHSGSSHAAQRFLKLYSGIEAQTLFCCKNTDQTAQTKLKLKQHIGSLSAAGTFCNSLPVNAAQAISKGGWTFLVSMFLLLWEQMCVRCLTNGYIFCCTDGAVNSEWKETGSILKTVTQKNNKSPNELKITTVLQKRSGEGFEKQSWGLRSQ